MAQTLFLIHLLQLAAAAAHLAVAFLLQAVLVVAVRIILAAVLALAQRVHQDKVLQVEQDLTEEVAQIKTLVAVGAQAL
jgi:hypothetical protein